MGAPTVSGGPGSLVSWAGWGATAGCTRSPSVRPGARSRPSRRRARPVDRDRHGHARARRARAGLRRAGQRPDPARAGRPRNGRAGAHRRLRPVAARPRLPTGTGYVNYVATAALQYLALGDVATVTLQYSRRPSPLSLGMVGAREQNRLLWLRVLQRLRDRPGPRPRVVLFGESLGAHTSQDVFLHWGTLGLDAMGIDRALWIGTPYGSKWMRQVTRGDRLDVDREAVAVVNDHAQLAALRTARLPAALRAAQPRQRRRHEVRPGPALVPPGLARPRPAPGRSRSPRAAPAGIPPAMRWRPITTFFQSLVDMKNAQTRALPGLGARLPRRPAPLPQRRSTGCPRTEEQLRRIEDDPARCARRVRETAVRRRPRGRGLSRPCGRVSSSTSGHGRSARVVYGSIIGMALVVTLSSHPPAPGVMAVWLLGTALAVGLAEVYSEVVGVETSTRQPVTRTQVRHMVEDAVAVAFGVGFPAVFFVLAALGVMDDRPAFTVAKWTGVA